MDQEETRLRDAVKDTARDYSRVVDRIGDDDAEEQKEALHKCVKANLALFRYWNTNGNFGTFIESKNPYV